MSFSMHKIFIQKNLSTKKYDRSIFDSTILYLKQISFLESICLPIMLYISPPIIGCELFTILVMHCIICTIHHIMDSYMQTCTASIAWLMSIHGHPSWWMVNVMEIHTLNDNITPLSKKINNITLYRRICSSDIT